MPAKETAPRTGLSRRNMLLSGGGLLAAGALGGWKWWHGYPDLVMADMAARSEAELFERGLVNVEHSGWTRTEGLAQLGPTCRIGSIPMSW